MTTVLLSKRMNIVPRWIIFTLDLLIFYLSFTVAHAIKLNFDISKLDYQAYSRNSLIICAISASVFAFFKTYTGIIRYTGAQDFIRILGSLLLSNFIFFLANIVTISFGNEPLISNSVLIIGALISFSAMMTYRILVKFFFMYIRNLKLDKIKVVIYGAGETGLATKRMVDHDLQVNKNIVAFVDDDKRKVGKTIDGISILDAAHLSNLIKERDIDEIIFASANIPTDHKNAVVDLCLENNVKVLNTPPREAWLRGKIQPSQFQKIKIEDLLNRDSIEIDITKIGSELSGKRVLITGAAGSIGSEIVRQLSKFDADMIIMCDQSETALHHLCLEVAENFNKCNFSSFIGDVKDEKRMRYLFETYLPHYVYHAAAYKHVPMMEDNAAEAIKTNVGGTKIIADLAVEFNVLKFVMISTDKAVNPTNVMGASKRIAEIYVQSLNRAISSREHKSRSRNNSVNRTLYNTRFITTRFGNVLGSNGSVIPRFRQQIEKGGPVTVTHPDITRYFMTIPEACRLVLEAGCMGSGGEIFIFDMGKSVKIAELAKTMIRLAGLIPDQDIKIDYTGLRPGEKLYEELLNDSENTLPTHHEKIMIGKVREYHFNDVEEQVAELLYHASNNDDQLVVKAMKQIVLEFKSKNSIFEQLDVVSKVI